MFFFISEPLDTVSGNYSVGSLCKKNGQWRILWDTLCPLYGRHVWTSSLEKLGFLFEAALRKKSRKPDILVGNEHEKMNRLVGIFYYKRNYLNWNFDFQHHQGA